MKYRSRRSFLQASAAGLSALAIGCTRDSKTRDTKAKMQHVSSLPSVFRSINGSPQQNMVKVLELLGGTGTLFGPNDIIIIKPNLQWWNQGAPNIAAVHALIASIMDRPGGFTGEVIIAENIHRGAEPWKTAGWAVPFVRNSDLHGIRTYSELADLCKKRYGDRFSVCHWIDHKAGGRRIANPADAPGYVICDGAGGVPLLSMDNGQSGERRREVVMSYPVMKTVRGTIVDFKNGVWENGSYTQQPVKFINCAALNHHSSYCGATSAIKNYLGVSDLSGGPDPQRDGRLTGKYCNFHSFPFDEWAKGPTPGMLGAEVGMFFRTIAKPFLNITTAEWVGLASRTEPPVARTRAVAASTDPVALDYHCMKNLLYPNSGLRVHNPDDDRSPLRHDLRACAEESGYTLIPETCTLISFDHTTGKLQDSTAISVPARIFWGTDFKALVKYFLFRFNIV